MVVSTTLKPFSNFRAITFSPFLRSGPSFFHTQERIKNIQQRRMLTFKRLSTLLLFLATVESFNVLLSHPNRIRSTNSQLNSFYSDSSDYKSSDSDFSSDDDAASDVGVPVGREEEEESPSIEETPVPMSKNAGNRFIALVFDAAIMASKGEKNIDVLDLHEERVKLTEDHVMFCRKANLYNETFNSESMADILWSNQM